LRGAIFSAVGISSRDQAGVAVFFPALCTSFFLPYSAEAGLGLRPEAVYLYVFPDDL
jgi:hypothetical protein